MTVANYIENIGDMIETNLVEAGTKRLNQGFQISPPTQAFLQALHDKVFWTVERSLAALSTADKSMAEEVMAAKLEINQLATAAENHLAQRLIVEEPHRLDAFSLETEIIEYLKRVYYFAKRIAKVIADADTVYKVMTDIDHGYTEVELKSDPEKMAMLK